MSTVWLNGRFLSEERARVPATHELVTHGVGVFESMRLVAGRVPLLDLHVERMRRSCRALGLRVAERDWDRMLAELARRNQIRSGRARLTVARDLALATCARLPAGIGRERREGIELQRAPRPRARAELKSASWLPVWLDEREAGGEVLLVDAGGALLETSRSNLFVVTERGLTTAAPPRVLPGVARGLVLELARELGVRATLRPPRWRDRTRWCEVFVTSALRGVRPVVSIDGARLPPPGPDSLTRRLQKALDQQMGL